MKTTSKKRILYGEGNYENMVRDNGYYVDKTGYIRLLEEYKNPVFLRPRRFGKTLWCRTLACYYDINQADQFEELFGHTDIGKDPTASHNQYMILFLNFAIVDPSGDIEAIRHRFNAQCNTAILSVVRRYRQYFENTGFIDKGEDAAVNLNTLLTLINDYDLPKLYILIDEYDNFANQLITSHRDALYRELTADDSFLKNFFKVLKDGSNGGTIASVFITGVLPITIDDLSSGYNIAEFITLEKRFETMLGFTRMETETLLDEIYKDYEFDPATRPAIMELLADNYNGYRFIDPQGEGLFNSTILMYFLKKFTINREIPASLIDLNLKTDISWVKRLTASNPANTEELLNALLIDNRLSYNESTLSEKFNMSRFFDKDFYPISFYYLGMITKRDETYMCLPNLNMRSIFADYFNDIHRVDVSTKYAELMSGFVNQPDIPALFAGYWELYLSQLPESIFQKVNENFYRTTFFELCRQHLSRYFTFAVEKSYNCGRTDLEFIGKYHTRFADLRFLLEFKYISNARWKKMKGAGKDKLRQFQPPAEDVRQLETYAAEWKKEHPHAGNKSFLVYCIGNTGFRVFPV